MVFGSFKNLYHLMPVWFELSSRSSVDTI